MTKQRGRKSGSVSFMQVELSELNRILKPDAKVIVSIRYAQLVGLQGKPVNSTMDVITHCVNSGKADTTLETFDENEEPSAPKKNIVHDADDDFVPAQADFQTFEEEKSPF
jgi:predicted Zn-dependent protease